MITAFGPLRFARRYTGGPDGGGYPADAALGVDGFLSRQASRMASLLGVSHPFDRAHRLLEQLCGWTVDAETIRRSTHATARRAAAERPGRADAGRFAAAPGEFELLIDAGKVNTRGGYRDVKLALFLGRDRGRRRVRARRRRRVDLEVGRRRGPAGGRGPRYLPRARASERRREGGLRTGHRRGDGPHRGRSAGALGRGQSGRRPDPAGPGRGLGGAAGRGTWRTTARTGITPAAWQRG